MPDHLRSGSPPTLSSLQQRILRFFREHPDAVETVRGIASWIGEEGEAIVAALPALLGRRWLTAHETSVVTGYALTRDEQMLAQIDHAMGAR